MDSFNQEKGRYSSVFPSLNMAVKRREQALQDYKRLQSKVEKYEEKEKTGPTMVKLHQAREELSSTTAASTTFSPALRHSSGHRWCTSRRCTIFSVS
ncbi:bridging integrator 3 homolog [Oncorhynchus keta]|uniref:bridging integrator 3 homolog n=1 Tax=Oncorhynchus keta TaxID=8018 RepID=UPI0015F9C587|nr:bridging integrator 3 homolog [Oncorhynchus keta]XP_035641491.1 bridging integrator 3 homolog [Oncorhynchus keta]XP_035641492.1 bridging integrator 3 homolog [Oncorhynchus keta]XP_052317432.1 bridging integrator 3 homolog [Oncorhynchus keta]